MQKHSLFLVLGLAFGVGNSLDAGAQQVRTLSLNEAVSLSITNNKSLKQSRYALDGAKAGVQEAKERRLPDVKVSGSYMRLNSPVVSGNLLQMMAGEPGGQGSEAGSIKVNQVAFGMANASLPLFSGNRINNGIKAAAYLEKAAAYDVAYQADLVIDNTIEAYYNLYKAQAYLKLVAENNRTALNRVKDFANLEKNGVIPRNDLLNVQLQQKNMELAILDAENNMQIANYNFDLMLGLDENTPLAVEGLNGEQHKQLAPIEEYVHNAVAERSDVKALDNRLSATQVNTKITKGAYLPSVALTGGYVAADVHNMLTVVNAMNVGVGLSYNIADLYKTGAKVKQARAREAEMEMAKSNLLDGVKIEIHKAYQDFRQSSQKVTVLKAAVELADENYKIVKNKYDNSLATATELLDADANKLQAVVNYEFSMIDNLIAYNKLLRASGQITSVYAPSSSN
ncbi:MAG: TolC family protein [Sphingobacteriales bacterium]|nr:MAG: TolC family protein [Sphingobacteriales bacterium]